MRSRAVILVAVRLLVAVLWLAAVAIAAPCPCSSGSAAEHHGGEQLPTQPGTSDTHAP